MSNKWYSIWTGGSSGNISSCYNNDYHQSDGYEYGGENFSIGNNLTNFIGNRRGFSLGYGATENNGNFRTNYEPRYGENYSGNFRGSYGQGYGDNASSNNRSNYRGNYGQTYGEDSRCNNKSNHSENNELRYGEDGRGNNRSSDRENYVQRYREDARSNNRSSDIENYEQRYGEDARSNDSSNFGENYDQRYGENVRSNDYENYSEKIRGGFKTSFRNYARDSHCGINYTGNNRERYNGDERRTDSDWTGQYYSRDRASGKYGQNEVKESYSSKKSIQDCLLEGSIVVVKLKKGRPKYQCLHCKITFFNEDHIEKKGHLGHVKHCLDVRGCLKATVGKRGFGLNFKKLYSQTNEGFKPKKVKTEPCQNAYEKDYIEKDIKEERIKQVVKLELDWTQEVVGGGFKANNLKDDVDFKKELNIKTEMDMDIEKNEDFRCSLESLKEVTSQERVEYYVNNQIKEELFSDINSKKKIIKTELAGKDVPEKNEKHHITKGEVTNLGERKAQEKKKERQKRRKESKKEKKKMVLKRVKATRWDPKKEFIKTELAGKDVPENNEKHHITKEEVTNLGERKVQEKKKERQKRRKESKKEKKKMALKRVKATRWDRYACLKPECLQTFQLWRQARMHMWQCIPIPIIRTKKRYRFTVKPDIVQSREKAQNQREMGTSMLKSVR